MQGGSLDHDEQCDWCIVFIDLSSVRSLAGFSNGGSLKS